MAHEKYGSAPIIFMDEKKREEWEALDESVKNNVFSMLHTCVEKLEIKHTLEMFCNVIIDMDKRIKELERK
jgi:hypothetical protein